MTRPIPTLALLLGSLSLLTLSGCERLEQAAAEAVEHARQSTAEVLDEAARTGSLESAKQKAGEALQEAKQKAAGLLGEASEYLATEPPAENSETPMDDPGTTAL